MSIWAFMTFYWIQTTELIIIPRTQMTSNTGQSMWKTLRWPLTMTNIITTNMTASKHTPDNILDNTLNPGDTLISLTKWWFIYHGPSQISSLLIAIKEAMQKRTSCALTLVVNGIYLHECLKCRLLSSLTHATPISLASDNMQFLKSYDSI